MSSEMCTWATQSHIDSIQLRCCWPSKYSEQLKKKKRITWAIVRQWQCALFPRGENFAVAISVCIENETMYVSYLWAEEQSCACQNIAVLGFVAAVILMSWGPVLFGILLNLLFVFCSILALSVHFSKHSQCYQYSPMLAGNCQACLFF